MDNKNTEEAKIEYISVVRYIYDLIRGEMDRYIEDPQKLLDIPAAYPKFVIMYLFFRMLRGEAFMDDPIFRPHTPEYQNRFYDMQNLIRERLEKLRSKLDPNDPLTQRYIKDMQDKFSLGK